MTDPHHADLQQQVKTLIAETLLLQTDPTQIGLDQPLFGPDSLGLDSVDALQLVVALDKHFGLKIADPGEAREVLRSVRCIVEALARHRAVGTPPQPGPG